MACREQMIARGERLIPRSCPECGIRRCPRRAPTPEEMAGAPAPRKGDWMQTAQGRQFWPMDPRADEIHIDDIAHALGMQCRYGGHSLRFYSVAEHCVHVASKAPAGLELAALMHDASEGYLADVIRPVKMSLSNYKGIESNLERVIAQRFGLAWPMPAEVKRLDERILQDERAQTMNPAPFPWASMNNDIEPLGVTLQFWTPAKARYEFLTAFYRYGGK